MAEAAGPSRPRSSCTSASRILEITFADGQVFSCPASSCVCTRPSAEVRGHGPGQEVLQAGKSDVGIDAIEPVGTYAVKLVFSDGHDTGLYTWSYLHELGRTTTASGKPTWTGSSRQAPAEMPVCRCVSPVRRQRWKKL